MNTKRKRRSREWPLVAGGIFIIVGSAFLARELNVALPPWLFRWEWILVIFGLSVLYKSRLRDLGGFVVLGIGLFFLADDIFPEWDTDRFFFPVMIIGTGLLLIVTFLFPWRKYGSRDDEKDNFDMGEKPIKGASPRQGPEPEIINFTSGIDSATSPEIFREEHLDIVSVFSANNKKVFSKNFTGGEIVCVFGGSEIELMNADITQGPIELEIVCIFGGATLFMPPNWLVRSEMGSVFGGIDDKRKNAIPDPNKVITIKGACVFGGLEIKSRGNF